MKKSKIEVNRYFCPNKECKLYGVTGNENIIGNGTYQIKNRRVRKDIYCERMRQSIQWPNRYFFDNVRKDESDIKLALKIATKERQYK